MSRRSSDDAERDEQSTDVKNRVFVFFVKLMAHSLSGWSGTNRWVDSPGAVVPLGDQAFRDQLEPDLGAAPRGSEQRRRRRTGHREDGRRRSANTGWYRGGAVSPARQTRASSLASVLSLLQVPGAIIPQPRLRFEIGDETCSARPRHGRSPRQTTGRDRGNCPWLQSRGLPSAEPGRRGRESDGGGPARSPSWVGADERSSTRPHADCAPIWRGHPCGTGG
jgi:hypothetical protein